MTYVPKTSLASVVGANAPSPPILAIDLANKKFVDASVDPGAINVRNFGAAGNGSTNDLPSFNSAMDFARANQIGRIYVPPGIYYLADDLDIEQTIVLEGASSPAWTRYTTHSVGESTLKFAPWKGVKVWSNINQKRGGYGHHSTLRHLAIEGGHATGSATGRTSVPVWTTATKTVGYKFLPTNTRVNQYAWGPKTGNTLEYYYECVQAGTPGAAEPVWQGNPANNDYFGPNESEHWQPNKVYYTGNVVTVPGRYNVSFMAVSTDFGIDGFGTSGSTQPAAFATAVQNQTVTGDGSMTWIAMNATNLFIQDGTAVYTRRLVAGVRAHAKMQVYNCTIRHWLNAAIHVQAAVYYGAPQVPPNAFNVNTNFPGPMGNANICDFKSVTIYDCGVQTYFQGGDANFATVDGMYVLANGSADAVRDSRNLGIVDRSFLGNCYSNCHVSGSGGPGMWIEGAANQSSISGARYFELDCGISEVYAPQCGLGPGGVLSVLASDSIFYGCNGSLDWRGVGATVRDSNAIQSIIRVKPDNENLLSFDAPTESLNPIKFSYAPGGEAGRGHFSFVSFQRALLSFSNERAVDGEGHLRFVHGYVEGSFTDRRFHFATPADYTFPGARQSRRLSGDHTRSNTFAKRGEYAERVVTTDGFVGPTWTPTTSVQAGQLSGRDVTPRSMVTPTVKNGYTYACLKGGVTGATEPVWPTTFWPSVETAPRLWTNNRVVTINESCQPSTPNGWIYAATTVPTVGTYEDVTVTTEPTTWPTTLNATVTKDGVTWTAQYGTNAASFVVDGSTIWQCFSTEARQEGAGYIRATGAATTTDATPVTLDTYDAVPFNSTKLYRVRVTAQDLINAEARAFDIVGYYKREVGAASQVAAPTSIVVASNATVPFITSTATLSVNGSSQVVVTVTGSTARTIKWTSELLP